MKRLFFEFLKKFDVDDRTPSDVSIMFNAWRVASGLKSTERLTKFEIRKWNEKHRLGLFID